jgi:hypothetical protein
VERESSFGTHEGPTLENRVLSTKTFTQPLSLFILFIISFILSLGHECLFSNNNTRIKRSLGSSILLFLLFYRATSGVSGNHAVFSCFIFSIISITQKKRHNQIDRPLQSLVRISTARADAHNTIIAPDYKKILANAKKKSRLFNLSSKFDR